MNFDMILPSTVTRQYKPHPHTYQSALKAFDLDADRGECLAFVAAHWRDLHAAGQKYVRVFPLMDRWLSTGD